VFVALGSNLGDRERHLDLARHRLAELPRTELVRASAVEHTEPVGEVPQGPYLNQMVLLRTDLDPHELYDRCRAIEREAGRERGERWGPRTLDLDIVRFGDLELEDPELQIPHPEIENRPFWLRELEELEPHVASRLPIELPPWAQVTEDRRAHIEGVAWVLASWADAMVVSNAERERWLRAAAYHDAVKDAPKKQLRALGEDPWGVDKLRHGPAAATLAERHGERDRGVLDAVRFHSVGYAGWDQVGRMLYLADYLEPGRTHRAGELEEQRNRVPRDTSGVLCLVTRERIAYLRRSGKSVLRETQEFWESLRCGA
jgi:2-amino-4-hydroxy-6-hydroxymethyldihydropteridine diphosphokinase